MLYFWILDYTPQVIYWVYTGSLRNCFWVLRSYLGKINIKRSFSVAVTWVVYLSLAQAPRCTEILLSGFSIWLSLQRQKRRFHYCWHIELIFSVGLCLEKPWNERIPCGLPHIPSTALNSSTASFFCTDHTLECDVSKHLRPFKQHHPPQLPSAQTERQWVQTIRDSERHFL